MILNYTFQNSLLQGIFSTFLFDFYCIFTYKCSALNENVGHSANYKNHTFWFSTIIPSWLWITHFKINCYRRIFSTFYLIFIAYLLINVQHCTKMLDIDSSQFFSSKKINPPKVLNMYLIFIDQFWFLLHIFINLHH